MADKKTGELMKSGVSVVGPGNKKVKLNYLISDKGGQGDVYHVSFEGRDYALKWYCKNPDDVIGGQQYNTIKEIYGAEKCPSEMFIWPLILVTEANPKKGKRFGYLMDLLPEGYFEMNDFLRMDGDPSAVRFQSYHAMLTAGMNIAAAMQKLHLTGLSYKDLNPKNFMFHPKTGDVLVVDNDNVSVSGGKCTVKGMKGYMAPEIPRSRYELSPTIETDYYSLAVILYQLFFVDHPMEGKLWERFAICTDQVEETLYALKPVFHFDPKNESNRPTAVYAPNVTSRWFNLPVEIREPFVKAFTVGINEPGRRSPEGEWITAISRGREKLIRMMVNGREREQFVNFDRPDSVPPRCLGIQIGGHKTALYLGKAIYRISVNGDVNKYGEIIAGISYSKILNSLVIRNLTDEVWQGWSPQTRQLTEIPKGKEYPISPGVNIQFQKANPARREPRIVGEIFNARVRR